jgi:hypothetical protein
MSRLSRKDMLPIMESSGALGCLDINEEDFLGGHGREDTYVEAIQEAYALGLERGIVECLMAVNDSDLAAESVRAVAGRLGVKL